MEQKVVGRWHFGRIGKINYATHVVWHLAHGIYFRNAMPRQMVLPESKTAPFGKMILPKLKALQVDSDWVELDVKA